MAEEGRRPSIFERISPLLLLLTVGLAFAVGVLWQKVTNLEKGTAKVAGTEAQPVVADDTAEPASGKLSDDQAKKLPEVSDRDHVRGNRNAEVFLIEYSDFECPYCASFHETAQQVVDEYGGRVAWVYRHFPLDSIHPQSRPGANAAECVAGLGGEDAFWGFIDAIFADLTILEDLEGTASKTGIDISSCLASKTYESVINSDYDGGLEAGVTGTPGNFVVNKQGETWLIPGALPFSSLQEVIDEAL
jgi:protein-disulfide isomerase